MRPRNYKISDKSSVLQVYFQILWAAKQFCDVGPFHKISTGSLDIRLDYENHSIRKGNDDPLK